jgi:hypothetical protein
MKAVRGRLFDEGLVQPWFDVCKSYESTLFPAEQMRWLATPEARWVRPKVSLDEHLAAERERSGKRA